MRLPGKIKVKNIYIYSAVMIYNIVWIPYCTVVVVYFVCGGQPYRTQHENNEFATYREQQKKFKKLEYCED